MSLQMSCGDTYQIWTWYSIANVFDNGWKWKKSNETGLVTPTPGKVGKANSPLISIDIIITAFSNNIYWFIAFCYCAVLLCSSYIATLWLFLIIKVATNASLLCVVNLSCWDIELLFNMVKYRVLDATKEELSEYHLFAWYIKYIYFLIFRLHHIWVYT